VPAFPAAARIFLVFRHFPFRFWSGGPIDLRLSAELSGHGIRCARNLLRT